MHITISITAPQGVAVNQDLLTVDVGPDMTVADLKAVIQSDTNVAPAVQSLYHNGIELLDDLKTLGQSQIKGDDMLAMLVRSPQASSGGGSQRQGQRNQARGAAQPGRSQGGQSRQGSSDDPEITRLQALGDPRVLRQIRGYSQELADVVHDAGRFQQLYKNLQSRQQNMESEKQRELALLNEDPFNVEAQAKIEEIIRQERVTENLQDAMDHTPEGRSLSSLRALATENPLRMLTFGRVHMLYIDVEVNSHKVKAFVDSGAQATIMSPTCAEKCGIMRLIDKRYSGVARGVGTAKILGRVHVAQIKIGTSFLPCSFTVMEGKDVDLLLGLDMLKRHQVCIDLEKNGLVIRGEKVPFLGEADIPKHEEVLMDEPTVEGPSGMQTGAISGVVSQSTDSTGPKGKGPETTSTTGGGGESSSAPATTASQNPGLPSSAAGTEPNFPPGDIAKITDLGFSRAEALHALELAGGDVDIAVGILL